MMNFYKTVYYGICHNRAAVILRKALVLLILLSSFNYVFAQGNKITGKVVDENGGALPGVSIKVKGTNVATISDSNGNYAINVPNENAILVFVYVGYQDQEKSVNGNSQVDIKLLPASGDLDEVVVVGYGTQKKINVSGAVSTITAKSIEKRPVANLSNALAGAAPGLYVRQGSGAPGSDGSTLTIRGVTTLSSSSILVLVDGVQGSLDRVNPQDVESVTVLKDAASTAIYGALGSNGVILVTTKKGSGEPSFNYNGTFSATNPTFMPKYVTSSVDFMNLVNESYANVGQAAVYTPAVIQQFAEGAANPDGVSAQGIPNYAAYANTDWVKYAVKQKMLQNHNLSLTGGSQKSSYLLSLGYINNPGVIDNSQYSLYRMRINVESKVSKYITVGTNTFAEYGQYNLTDLSNFLSGLKSALPTIYPYYDGYYGAGPINNAGNNVVLRLVGTKGTSNRTSINTNWYLKANLLKGLSFEPRVAYAPSTSEYNAYTDPSANRTKNFYTGAVVLSSDQADPTNSTTSNSFSKSSTLTMESLLRYNTTIAQKHNLGALVGYNQFRVYGYATSISAKGLPDGSITAISAASSFPSNPTGGSTSNYAFRSFFGRLNYSYDDKYSIEANLRRDGSSRFGPENKYGYFPSFSASWNVDKEAIFKGLFTGKLNNLKIRGSFGKVGNSNIGDYVWQNLYATGTYNFNGIAAKTLFISKLGNPFLQWETTQQTDVGVNLVAFKYLTFEVDWYNKNTTGILFVPTVDITHGTSTAPTINLASLNAKGLDLSLGWNSKVGAVDYSVSGNFMYNYVNKVTKYNGALTTTYGVNPVNGGVSTNNNISAVSSGSSTRIVEGHRVNEYYMQNVYKGSGNYYTSNGAPDPNGGPKDGMIRTDEDLNWVKAMQAAGYKFGPVNTVGAAQLYKGDLLYADNNNDGTYGNAADAQFMNFSSEPKYVFGLNLRAAYKGFDFSAIFAGIAGVKYYTYADFVNTSFVNNAVSIPLQVANDHYSTNNPNGIYPRLRPTGDINNTTSDFWLKDGSYVKLKNVQLGYTLPEKVLGKLGGVFKSFNVYISAENLFTISGYKVGDPELGNVDIYYPLMRQYSAGINARF